MKQPLPYTRQHFNELKRQHKVALELYKQKKIRANNDEVHRLMEEIFKYENAVLYNTYATNRCKFNTKETNEICEKVFKNTYGHFTMHGNCCQSCSNYFTNRIKPSKDDVTVDDLIKQKPPEYFIDKVIHTKQVD